MCLLSLPLSLSLLPGAGSAGLRRGRRAGRAAVHQALRHETRRLQARSGEECLRSPLQVRFLPTQMLESTVFAAFSCFALTVIARRAHRPAPCVLRLTDEGFVPALVRPLTRCAFSMLCMFSLPVFSPLVYFYTSSYVTGAT